MLLPGGAFRMGASPGDALAAPNEHPAGEVVLAPFFLSRYELTQGQWLRVFDANPSERAGAEGTTPAHPVDSLSWHDARLAAARLDLALPTEAQWEYAARAGRETPWWTGPDPPEFASFGALTEELTAPVAVGGFPPNPYGLHDLEGNVREWCRDLSGPYSLPVTPHDGERLAPADEGNRAIRGANVSIRAEFLPLVTRASMRFGEEPHNRQGILGVRLSRGVR